MMDFIQGGTRCSVGPGCTKSGAVYMAQRSIVEPVQLQSCGGSCAAQKQVFSGSEAVPVEDLGLLI